MGITLEGKGRLSHNFKWLSGSYKPKESFFRTDTRQLRIAGGIHLSATYQPYGTPLHQIKQPRTGRDFFILGKGANPVMFL